MTDDVERELARVMRDRAASLPVLHDAQPATIARARRRRLTKLGALATATAVAVVGTAAVVAQAAHDERRHVVSTDQIESGHHVSTVRCPVVTPVRNGLAPPTFPAPSTVPRAVPAGDAESLAGLVSYAPTDDPVWVVLGPKGWTCGADLAADGSGSVAVSPRPNEDHASIFVTSGLLWGETGAEGACGAHSAAAIDYLRRHKPEAFPCEAEGAYTRIDAHVTMFRGPGGARGASWIDPPSSDTADDGRMSVIRCAPTEELSAADCDTIVADWIARVDATSPDATPVTVPTTICPINYLTPPAASLLAPFTGSRAAAGAAGLVAYAATRDERYVVLGPKDWVCDTTVDGNRGQLAISPSRNVDHAGIFMIDMDLWHGITGSNLACSASNDPTVIAYVREHTTSHIPCEPDRVITRVDEHSSTFRDPGGMVGASRLVLPSSETADDGRISILNCTPTEGLSAAQCDTIIADWVARVGAEPATPPPTTTPPTAAVPAGSVPQAGCAGTNTAGAEIAPSQPRAGDPALYAGLGLYLADVDGDPRFTVLGPRGWGCALLQGQNGRSAIVVSNASRTTESAAPIAINRDRLWHGGVGSSAACAVFDNAAVVQFVTQHYPSDLPCPKSGRTVTSVRADYDDAQIASFADADGTRGAAWMLLPTAQAPSGFIDVLTCRPIDGLSIAQCETIAADYAARADSPAAPG